MPWPLREDLVLSSFPSPEDMHRNYWEGDTVSMITLSKKKPVPLTYDGLGWWKYHHIPDGIVTPDRQRLIYEARDTVLAMMTRPGNRLTVIHCLAGRSRSGLVGALVLQWLNNWTGEEAMNYVRQCRPKAVNNVHFEQFLMGLGRPY